MTAPQNISAGGLLCVKARWFARWRGAWTLDLDVDPNAAATVTAATVPTGKLTTTIGDNVSLVGSVDARSSARFVASLKLKVIAGGGGWDKLVPAQDFANASGVPSTAVESATASLVGETVNDPQPISLGLRWERLKGPASRIFGNPIRDWYVDAAGVTQIGTWPTAKPDATVEVLTFDPDRQVATLSADALILPGTVLTDTSSPPKWDGPLTVRDVEQVWDKEGTRATVWFATGAQSRLTGMLRSMVAEYAGVASLKRWIYTIVSQKGSGAAALLNLQATANPDGSESEAPPLANCPIWPGLSGASATYKPSSKCAVVFLADGWSDPVVVHFDGSVLPIESIIDATGVTHIGPSGNVELAGGGPGAARFSDTTLSYLPPLCPMSGVVSGTLPFVGIIQIPGPLIGSIQTSSNKVTIGLYLAPVIGLAVYEGHHGNLLELLVTMTALVLVAWLLGRRPRSPYA